MANLRRLRVTWGGNPVTGPGVSTFYSLDTDSSFPTDIYTFFSAAPALFPAGLTISVPNEGDVIDSATGALVGVWSTSFTPSTMTGTDTGDYAKGVGMQMRWKTGGIVGGRRVVGSTFIVPIAAGTFDTDGTIDTASVTAMNTRAATLLTNSPGLCIWSRPTPTRAGVASAITSGTLADRVSWLRSRRT